MPRPTASVCGSLLSGRSPREWLVYLGAALAIVLFVMLVSGFALFTSTHRPVSLLSGISRRKHANTAPAPWSASPGRSCCGKPAGRRAWCWCSASLVAFGYLIVETFRLPRIPRHRMFVVLILTFFSMVFFAFLRAGGKLAE